ncbi:MAG: DNA damage-inducible protein D [Ignavibacteria bacterium GWB2_35_12]|nr:MAG: DNA damage-inducible protein D [Ignavibacteria bacterium GWB2_35_12]OGU92696.1 MAG: DNA damage-inducible protein D [Ignavibacteria bacterium RIFOXYA2_FULL_35_10]OGV22448.1 MAG: DNA damage-inducible protein D [Ignavibacteria bacterium RIFOXYC2_FULL_35_21]
MKTEIVKSLTDSFESKAHFTDDIEYWFARDLQILLGYTQWRNFELVIEKAKISCETSNHAVSDHFADVSKTIDMPKSAKKDIDDIMLTRFACYLIAQNGDPRKEQIAFAQNYFAVQTRKFELIEKRINDWERLMARQKLSLSEKELSKLIFERIGNEKSFSTIRSRGDKALFGFTTQQMKDKLNIPDNRPLADFLPTITIKAKDFATEITVFKTKEKNLNSEIVISDEHLKNNKEVRNLLLRRGIKPEELPADEDIKKLERRLNTEDKSIQKKSKRIK